MSGDLREAVARAMAAVMPPNGIDYRDAADAALAIARPHIEREAWEKAARALPGIMKDEWDEICNDTGCHPEDIYRASPRDRKTWFKHGHWTRAIAAAIRKGTE